MHGPNLLLIFVDDIKASADFYEKIFDWTPSPYAPQGGVHYLTDTISVILLPEGAFRSGTTGAVRGYGMNACFQTSDIDAMYLHVCSTGARIVLEPEESGYGVTFTFADPSGNRITFYAEPQEDED